MAFNHIHSPYWRPFAMGLLLLVLVSALPASSAPYPQQTTGPAVPIKQFDACNSSGNHVVNDTLLFIMSCYDDNSLQSVTLWRSDGTEAGTVPLTTLPVNSISATAYTNTTFFFWMMTSEGAQLWKSDGTAQGTLPLKNIRSVPLITVGNLLYFIVITNQSEEYPPQWWELELWRSDGTVEGTFLLKQMITERQYLESVTTPQIAYFPIPLNVSAGRLNNHSLC